MREQSDYDIVIIDSGLRIDLTDSTIYPPDFYEIGGDFQFHKSTDYHDDIGHGTSVFRIVANEAVNANICIIRIFSAVHSVNESTLLAALKFVDDNFTCRLINLSLGLSVCDNLRALESRCQSIVEKGTIITAAFDNDGTMSYPAAFDCVIGVDNWYQCKSINSFEFVSSGPVNIRAKGGLQRIRWNNHSAVIGGSSFACAHMTAFIFNIIRGQQKQLAMSEVLDLLKKQADHIYPDYSDCSPFSSLCFKVHKAVVFPFNKEMHSLARFSSDLTFEISAVYDIAQSGHVGMNTNRIVLNSNAYDKNGYIIQNIKAINNQDYDTLILGHMEEINRISGYNMRDKLIREALDSGKNVFSFDHIDSSLRTSYPGQVYHPQVFPECTYNNFGKLYQTNKPVVCVCGTSSAQGKFALQMILRKLIIEAGYSIGQISSEPHAQLFGMDYTIPIEYSSDIELNEWEMISVLNKAISQLDDRDIILAGSQSNSIPLNMNNLSVIPVRINSFLLGVNPDIVILTVNPDDSPDYIVNTIKYIEGVTSATVLALVIFPMVHVDDWRRSFDIKRPLTNKEFLDISSFLTEITGLPMYMLGYRDHMEDLLWLLLQKLS